MDNNLDDRTFRRLTTSQRDLPSYQFDRQARIVYYLWQNNAMASRIIELMVDFIMGDGITWSVPCKKLDDILWEFWSDPDNDFELFQYSMVEELFLYGEFILPLMVLEPSGKVKTGYIDPINVIEVVKNPFNSRIAEELRIKVENESGIPEEKVVKVIKRDKDVLSKTFGKLIGDVMLFQINKVSNASRGISELYRLADWIDGLDNSLFSSLERIYHLMSYIWDVTIKDVYDKKQLEEIKQEILKEPFTPSSIHIHSDKQTINTLSPDLKSEQITNYVELLRNFVLGGAGIPTSWYGEGDITRATAQEQGTPVLRKLRRKQKYVKKIFEKIFEFVKEKAIDYKRIEKGKDYQNEDELNIEVVMSEIAGKDIVSLINSMDGIVKVLVMAENQEWISKDRAREIYNQFMKRILDIDIEPENEIEDKLAEAENKKILEYYERIKHKEP